MPLERISQGFKDISMSFQVNPLNLDLIALKNETAIARSVRNIVFTLPGEKFFEDCGSYDTYIKGIKTNNGKYNLILAQPTDKLRKFRENLARTTYYDMWDDEYLQEILENDYDVLEKRDSNPVKSSDLTDQESTNGKTIRS